MVETSPVRAAIIDPRFGGHRSAVLNLYFGEYVCWQQVAISLAHGLFVVIQEGRGKKKKLMTGGGWSSSLEVVMPNPPCACTAQIVYCTYVPG